MEQIKNILPKNKWGDNGIKFVEYGLGLMREEERELLLEIGAIKHIGGIDVITCEGVCVNIYRNGNTTCVFEGTEFECQMEMEKIKRDKLGIDVRVKFYPKAYFEYYNKERARRIAKDLENEYNDQLLQEVGFN